VRLGREAEQKVDIEIESRYREEAALTRRRKAGRHQLRCADLLRSTQQRPGICLIAPTTRRAARRRDQNAGAIDIRNLFRQLRGGSRR